MPTTSTQRDASTPTSKTKVGKAARRPSKAEPQGSDSCTDRHQPVRDLIRQHAGLNRELKAAVARNPDDPGDDLVVRVGNAEIGLIAALDALKPEPSFPGPIEETGAHRPFQAVRADGRIFARFQPPDGGDDYLVVLDEREIIDLDTPTAA